MMPLENQKFKKIIIHHTLSPKTKFTSRLLPSSNCLIEIVQSHVSAITHTHICLQNKENIEIRISCFFLV